MKKEKRKEEYKTNERKQRQKMGGKKKIKRQKNGQIQVFLPFVVFFIIEEFCHLHKKMGGVVPHHDMQHNEPITTMCLTNNNINNREGKWGWQVLGNWRHTIT